MNRLIPLETIAEIEMGNSPPGDTYNASQSGEPLLNGPTEFTDHFPVATQWTQQGTRFCKPGDILICVRGSTGRMNIADRKYAIGRGLAAIRAREGLACTEFLQHVLELQTSQILKLATGSTFPSIDKKSIGNCKVGEFSLPEQKAIAAVLSTWDRGIRQLTDLIAAKLRFKQGLMQQLLTGKRRFPGFTGEWEMVRIGLFLTESRIPGTHGAEARKLTVKLYGKGVIPKSDTRTGSEATKYYRRKAGQFIYSKLDFLNGAFGIVSPELDEYESTLDLPAFDIGASVDPAWFLYFVVREDFYKNLLGLANGGRKARRVNPDDLLKVSIPCPTKAEQQRIADVLNAADREIDILRRKLDILKQQKKGLMQKLLTGEVRVKVQASGGR